MPLTKQAHNLIKQHFTQHTETPKELTSLAIDATCGNGSDTLFLAQFGFKKVVSFDIQQQAIDATNALLKEHRQSINLNSIHLALDGHENLAGYIEQTIDCAMFNLGFLPKADKTLTTNAKTTVLALESAIKALSNHGLITILCYPGHGAGKTEARAVRQWIETLNEPWRIESYLSQSPTATTPFLVTIHNKTP